jgi:dihydroorotate dehydrogenase electron transfer subunit
LSETGARSCRHLQAFTVANTLVSERLMVLELKLPEPLDFLPGQFAMINFPGSDELVFSRPFSILATDRERVSFLYRVVGRGTRLMAQLAAGDPVVFLGPLGNPFPPPPADSPVILLAGGVGLPPLLAWKQRYGRPQDTAFFGGRDGADVPWGLLDTGWHISVDHSDGVPAERTAFTGVVTDCCRDWLRETSAGSHPCQVLACGPLPLLAAANQFACEFDWPCLVSVEEHMGCGYGVCRGCVIPTGDGGHLTACQDGPVVAAERIDWRAFARTAALPAGGSGPDQRRGG